MNPSQIPAAASSGVFMTLAIIYAMQALIAMQSGPAIEQRVTPKLIFRPTVEDEELVLEAEPFMDRPEFQEEPKTPRPSQESQGYDPIGISRPGPPPPGPRNDTIKNPVNDGPLVVLVRVQPNYPAGAIRQGLEGYVIVEFDVTANGKATNVVARMSSHALFERAAIEAAKRLRYKPRIVDGVAVQTRGLRYRFTFEMEN